MLKKLKNFAKDALLLEENIANNILTFMGSPTPKSELFDYQYYDSATGLFYTTNTSGFVLRADPIVGVGSGIDKQIGLLFDDCLPFGGTLQTLLLASDDVDQVLDKWLDTRSKSDAIYRKLEEHRTKFIHQHNENSENQFKCRDYKLFFAYSGPKPKEFRARLQPILLAMNINASSVDADEFLALVAELINYPDYGFKKYNQNELLANQVNCGKLEVKPEQINHGSGAVSRCYMPAEFPKWFAIEQIPHLLGDGAHEMMQIPSRFALSYTISNDITNARQSAFVQKGEAVIKSAGGLLAALNRDLKSEVEGWQQILNENIRNKERFLTRTFCVLISSKESEIEKTEQSLISLWKKNDVDLKLATYFQLPSLLSFCPFHRAAEKVLKQFSLSQTVLSSEPKALLPIHAEYKGNSGMLLVGRRGQLCLWDSFEGGSNYNVCVVGESGSGKSVFLQEYVLSQLARDARVFVIDLGRSFEKLCNILGGDFIYFGSDTQIQLDPFSSCRGDLVEDSLSMLKLVVAKMAAPKSGTSDIQDALIAKSIAKMWSEFGSDSSLDLLAQALQTQGILGEEIATMLFEFTSKGSYGKFFGRERSVKFQKDITVFEFEELRERPDLGAVIMQMLAIQIVQQVYLSDRKQRFIILFDEAWYALDHFAQMLASLARTVRKYNGALVLGTQSLGDFYSGGDPAKLGVIANSAWRVLLKQKPDSAAKALEIGLGQAQVDLINSLQKVDGKYSECLIWASSQEYFVTRLMLDKFSQILYSSHPEVFAKIKELQNRGFSALEAIEKIVEGCEK